jgi:hypothetical protein
MDSLAKPLGLSIDDAEKLGRHFITPVILLVVFAALGLFARFRRDAGLCFVCFALFPLVLFTANLGVINVVFNTKSARELAQKIPALPPQTALACLECFPVGLPFYLDRTVTLISTDGRELMSNYIVFRLKNETTWPANMVAATNFDQWISERTHPVYLLAREKDRSRLEAIAGVQKNDIQPLPQHYLGVLLPAP